MALWSTQSLTKMSTRNLPGGRGGGSLRPTTLPQSVSRMSRENVGASTSHNSMGLHDLLQGQIYINFVNVKQEFLALKQLLAYEYMPSF
jgi:hypothetical protein